MVMTVMTKQYVAYDFLWGFQLFIGLIFVLFFTRNYISYPEFLLWYRIIVKLKDPRKHLVNKLRQDFLTTSKMVVEKEIVFSIEEKTYDKLQSFNKHLEKCYQMSAI